MKRRDFLRKAPIAAAALALPAGVAKLIEGIPPDQATVVRAPMDPYAYPRTPKQRWEVGWKFVATPDPTTKADQFGAVLITDTDVPIEALGDIIARQMAETLVEVIGKRRSLALAKRMARSHGITV
jgi:hypothetical protein